jgi:hypothetical protein
MANKPGNKIPPGVGSQMVDPLDVYIAATNFEYAAVLLNRDAGQDFGPAVRIEMQPNGKLV